jgi:hypothetical protein
LTRSVASNGVLVAAYDDASSEAAMPESRCPRLSQAMLLLPLLRAQLGGAASGYLLPAGLAIDLLPIVEDGVFGYELLPNRDTHTYLTFGADANDAPIVRRNLYCTSAPSALRMATIGGRPLLQHELDAWDDIEQRDTRYSDWPSAAAAAWAELDRLFADRPRHTIEIHDAAHAAFDHTLGIARSRLCGADPSIEFCGLPEEAQYGFVLKGPHGRTRQSGASIARLMGASLEHGGDPDPRTMAGDPALRWGSVGVRGRVRRRPDAPMTFRHRDDQRKAARRRR